MNKDQIIWNFIFTVAYLFLIFISGWILYSLNRLPISIGIFDFFILSLATFRLIRLFVYDYITKYIRDYLGKFESGPGKTIFNLLDCPWCTGVWMALFTSFFYFLTPFAWYPLFLLAIAGMATYLQLIILKIGKDL
jgi:hypothetical protein